MQSITKKINLTETLNKRGLSHFWKMQIPYRWLPLLLGSSVGILLAFLISEQNWLAVASIVLVVPLAILFSKYPFTGFLIWFLATPLVVQPTNPLYLTIWWVLHRGVIPITLVAVLLPYLYRLKPRWPMRISWPELAMVFFLGVVILSALVEGPSNKIGMLYKIYDRFIIGFFLYLVMRLTSPNDKDLKLLVSIAVCAAIFQSIIGLLSNFAPEVLPDLWSSHKQRTVGTFNAPGRYTSMLVFCSFIIYQVAMQSKKSRVRWLLLIVFLLSSLMIFLTYAKASWLAGSLALLGLLILYPLPTLRISAVAAVLMVFFGAGLLANQLAFAFERLEDDSTQERTMGNVAMLGMIEAKPFFGWGYGRLNEVLPQFVVRLDDYAAKKVAPHNTYLPMMAQVGLVGFSLYIFPILSWLILTIRAWPHMPKAGFTSRSLVVILWLIMLNQLIVSNTSDFDNGQSGVFAICLWWATLGFIASLVQPYLNSNPRDTLSAINIQEKGA